MVREQMHPLVREMLDVTANPPAVPETPVTEEPVAEVSPVAEPVAETVVEPEASEPPTVPEPTPEPEWLLKLDTRNLYQELRRAETEREDIRQVLSTYAGRSAAKKYEPQIRQKDAKIAELEQRLAAAELSTMDEDEVNQKLRTDPAFRRKVDLVQEPIEDVEYINQWATTFDDAFEASGVHPQREMEYRKALAEGYFGDLDADPQRAFATFQRTLLWEVNQARAASAAPSAPVVAPEPVRSAPAPKAIAVAEPPEPVKPHVNPDIANAKPDLSAPGHSSTGGTVRLSEVRQMTPIERIKRFGADLQAAINSGEVVVDV